jgi:protein Mpv17
MKVFDAFKAFLALYSGVVEKKPFLTNAVTGFFIASAGDILCQQQNYNSSMLPLDTAFKPSFSEVYDAKRTLRMGAIRGLIVTPFVLKWYPTLLKLSPGKTLSRVVSRIIIDQCIGSPIVITLVFVTNLCLFQQQSLHNLFVKLKSEGRLSWIRGLQYWPLVHLITFGLVPLKHQTLFAHFMSIYWMYILSFYSNTNKTTVKSV